MVGGYRFPYGTCGRADCGIFHMTVTGYFESIFEVVRHEIDREDAKKYVAMMGKYHHGGLLAIVGENDERTVPGGKALLHLAFHR